MLGQCVPIGWRESQKRWEVVIIHVELVIQFSDEVQSVMTNLHVYTYLDVIDDDVS